jgi:hypothetical protein
VKLEHEFIQLPILFDPEKLAEEVKNIASNNWVAHHEGFKGNSSTPLVSVNGEKNNDFKGPMACTDVLEACPYLKQVIASFGEVIGRSRLMGLEPGSEVPLHSDINYHWYKRVRIHIPIVTDSSVIFHCSEKKVHMQAGEAWIFDSWKYHKVKNDSDIFRIHLVIDITGSAKFWDFVKQGRVPWITDSTDDFELSEFSPSGDKEIITETFNSPLVMSPGEIDYLADELIREIQCDDANPQSDAAKMIVKVNRFCQDWRCLWSQYGLSQKGWPHYHSLRQSAYEGVKAYDGTVKLSNGTPAPRMFLHCIIDSALNVEVESSFKAPDAMNTPQIQIDKPVPRNALCPCDSGKKYKHCHGLID